MSGISIKSIAQIAGVSRGTVDRALNGRPGIKPEIKARILEVAHEHGYISNRAGKLLGLRKSPIRIGVHLPSQGNPFFDDVIKGINDAALEYKDFGLTITLSTMKGFSPEQQIKQIRDMVSDGVNALALVPINSPLVSAFINDLGDSGLPVITLNSDIQGCSRMGYVGNDYLRSGSIAAGMMRLILNQRKGKLVLLTGSQSILGHNQRIQGFTENIKANLPGIEILKIVETQDDDDRAYDLMIKAIHEYPDMTGVYASAGGIGGICRAIMDSNLSGRLDVICHDITEIEREYLKLGVITLTIGQQPYDQGYKPIKYLFEYFLSGNIPPQHTYTESQIFIREQLS